MMRGRPPLTREDLQILDGLAIGEHSRQIAKRTGFKVPHVKQRLTRLYKLLDLDIEEPQRNWRVLLAQWWRSEIFRIGLKELGMLPQNRRAA
jgi:DNA-binding NarL/FixJ family response regulator